MNAVERLEAAIAKLERLRAEIPYMEMSGWLVETYPGDRAAASIYVPPEDLRPVTDDALLVTLHRTIDAQLAILRFAVDGLYDLPEFIMLADAILGDNS